MWSMDPRLEPLYRAILTLEFAPSQFGGEMLHQVTDRKKKSHEREK